LPLLPFCFLDNGDLVRVDVVSDAGLGVGITLRTNLRTPSQMSGTFLVTARDLNRLTYCSGGNGSVKTTGFDIADVTPNQLRCN